MLILALRRAVIDKTTTSRSSYDKAVDVSNVAFHHNSFPYPIFPMKIGRDLATLLESHPTLPFQGAGRLLSSFQLLSKLFSISGLILQKQGFQGQTLRQS